MNIRKNKIVVSKENGCRKNDQGFIDFLFSFFRAYLKAQSLMGNYYRSVTRSVSKANSAWV